MSLPMLRRSTRYYFNFGVLLSFIVVVCCQTLTIPPQNGEKLNHQQFQSKKAPPPLKQLYQEFFIRDVKIWFEGLTQLLDKSDRFLLENYTAMTLLEASFLNSRGFDSSKVTLATKILTQGKEYFIFDFKIIFGESVTISSHVAKKLFKDLINHSFTNHSFTTTYIFLLKSSSPGFLQLKDVSFTGFTDEPTSSPTLPALDIQFDGIILEFFGIKEMTLMDRYSLKTLTGNFLTSALKSELGARNINRVEVKLYDLFFTSFQKLRVLIKVTVSMDHTRVISFDSETLKNIVMALFMDRQKDYLSILTVVLKDIISYRISLLSPFPSIVPSNYPSHHKTSQPSVPSVYYDEILNPKPSPSFSSVNFQFDGIVLHLMGISTLNQSEKYLLKTITERFLSYELKMELDQYAKIEKVVLNCFYSSNLLANRVEVRIKATISIQPSLIVPLDNEALKYISAGIFTDNRQEFLKALEVMPRNIRSYRLSLLSLVPTTMPSLNYHYEISDMVALSPSTIVGEEIIHIHDQTGSTGVQGEEPIFVPRKSSGAEPVFNASSSIPSLQSNPNPSNRPSMLSSTMDLLSSVSKKNLPYQIFPTIHKFFFNSIGTPFSCQDDMTYKSRYGFSCRIHSHSDCYAMGKAGFIESEVEELVLRCKKSCNTCISNNPSSIPSANPTSRPSIKSSNLPSQLPSNSPLMNPSSRPSLELSSEPSWNPSRKITTTPTLHPTSLPTSDPSSYPSFNPSTNPLTNPSLNPSLRPTLSPTSEPSMDPTSYPSLNPSKHPTFRPSLHPSSHPSSQPSFSPSLEPSIIPSINPTLIPSQRPSLSPLHHPSSKPSFNPSKYPSINPSHNPTLGPTAWPSSNPSLHPSSGPSTMPSHKPSHLPSSKPTQPPSSEPALKPSLGPSTTMKPSRTHSSKPSSYPSLFPSSPPSKQPSSVPTLTPSIIPSPRPSIYPSLRPTCLPSLNPSLPPSLTSSFRPSSLPSSKPSVIPSLHPSVHPSLSPTSSEPSSFPSLKPSTKPSSFPSFEPSIIPSNKPSLNPSSLPTNFPYMEPSISPSAMPSMKPSMNPSISPSILPSSKPSLIPSPSPSLQPSKKPSMNPSITPSQRPTLVPSYWPSIEPTSLPSLYPSPMPSLKPSIKPSLKPSLMPLPLPSSKPSTMPSMKPSKYPSSKPTSKPSHKPSKVPTAIPTRTTAPTICQDDELYRSRYGFTCEIHSYSVCSKMVIAGFSLKEVEELLMRCKKSCNYCWLSQNPSQIPSRYPTKIPSDSPTLFPTFSPSTLPSSKPSKLPVSKPSFQPSPDPSYNPSLAPSSHPSLTPSFDPSLNPSYQPSSKPVHSPSTKPSSIPSYNPSMKPSNNPTYNPSDGPTLVPSIIPSSVPSISRMPTFKPSLQPTLSITSMPSNIPSFKPSLIPTIIKPSRTPSYRPSHSPSMAPSYKPSYFPSTDPSPKPTHIPSYTPSFPPTYAPTITQAPTPCQDDPTYVSPFGFKCKIHSHTKCARMNIAGFSMNDVFELLVRCKISCNTCTSERFPSTVPSSTPSYKPSLSLSHFFISEPTHWPSFFPTHNLSNMPSLNSLQKSSLNPSLSPSIHLYEPIDKPSFRHTFLPSFDLSTDLSLKTANLFSDLSAKPSLEPLPVKLSEILYRSSSKLPLELAHNPSFNSSVKHEHNTSSKSTLSMPPSKVLKELGVQISLSSLHMPSHKLSFMPSSETSLPPSSQKKSNMLLTPFIKSLIEYSFNTPYMTSSEMPPSRVFLNAEIKDHVRESSSKLSFMPSQETFPTNNKTNSEELSSMPSEKLHYEPSIFLSYIQSNMLSMGPSQASLPKWMVGPTAAQNKCMDDATYVSPFGLSCQIYNHAKCSRMHIAGFSMSEVEELMVRCKKSCQVCISKEVLYEIPKNMPNITKSVLKNSAEPTNKMDVILSNHSGISLAKWLSTNQANSFSDQPSFEPSPLNQSFELMAKSGIMPSYKPSIHSVQNLFHHSNLISNSMEPSSQLSTALAGETKKNQNGPQMFSFNKSLSFVPSPAPSSGLFNLHTLKPVYDETLKVSLEWSFQKSFKPSFMPPSKGSPNYLFEPEFDEESNQELFLSEQKRSNKFVQLEKFPSKNQYLIGGAIIICFFIFGSIMFSKSKTIVVAKSKYSHKTSTNYSFTSHSSYSKSEDKEIAHNHKTSIDGTEGPGEVVDEIVGSIPTIDETVGPADVTGAFSLVRLSSSVLPKKLKNTPSVLDNWVDSSASCSSEYSRFSTGETSYTNSFHGRNTRTDSVEQNDEREDNGTQTEHDDCTQDGHYSDCDETQNEDTYFEHEDDYETQTEITSEEEDVLPDVGAISDLWTNTIHNFTRTWSSMSDSFTGTATVTATVTSISID